MSRELKECVTLPDASKIPESLDVIFRTRLGYPIFRAITEAVEVAKKLGSNVMLEHNARIIYVAPDELPGQIYNRWMLSLKESDS